MADRNKSDLTRLITEKAALWLEDHGFKPVETEVSLHGRWIADLAAVGSMTRTEAQRLKLLARKPRWRADRALDEFQTQCGIWEAQYRLLPPLVTAAVEVKISYGDFAGDIKWLRTPRSHLLYLAAPVELWPRLTLPDYIGRLELSHGGEVLRCRKSPQLQEITLEQTLRVLYQIAVRRDHFTRYARHREFAQQSRSTQNGYINRTRVNGVLDAVIQAMQGQCDIEEALRQRLGRDCDGYTKETIDRFNRCVSQLTGRPGDGLWQSELTCSPAKSKNLRSGETTPTKPT